jgi:hypothetical protein
MFLALIVVTADCPDARCANHQQNLDVRFGSEADQIPIMSFLIVPRHRSLTTIISVRQKAVMFSQR